MTLQGFTFLGKYSGCRFGNEEPDDAGEVRDCDFSQADLFHLCDFLAGSEVATLHWPAWPHLVVTDLARSAGAWGRIELPEELKIVRGTIADGPPARAVSVYLPAETDRASELRELFASVPYIILAEQGSAAGGGGR